MDDFERFWMEREREELEIEPEKLRKVLSKILKEFNLELKSIEETEEKDLVATCLDKLGREVTSLIRIRADTEGIERDDVEDFYEDMVEKRAVAAIFITTSYFFKDAKDFVEGLPIRLVDRTQLSEIIAEIEAIKVEKAFVSGMNDSQVVKYFQKKIKGRVLGRFGMPENIEEIDRRYLPIGFFSLKKIEENVERRKFAYIDLSSGDLFYIDEGRIKKDDIIKNILNLPPESREHLMDLIEHGELPHEHIDGKHLVILKKRGLLGEYEEGRGGGILSTMVNGIMSLVMIIIDTAGEFVGIPRSEHVPKEGTAQPKRVKARVNIPIFDQAYNLENFMEVSNASEEFDPDPMKYKPEEVEDILRKITGYEVKFENMVYFPYYLCKYSGPRGERYRRLYSVKFKEFFPRPGTYNVLYHIIDKFPELPYLILAVLYIHFNISETEKLMHVFSSSFLFLIICVFTGTLLKAIFKTERVTPYYGVSVFRYGFPSMHSLASIGAIGFVYFIEPMGPLLSLVLVPIGLLYVYSRIKIGAHSVTDVIGGAIIGLIMGIISGMHLLKIYLPYPLELIFTTLFVTILFIFIIIRIKYIH